jgi:hypothetical protein
MATCPPGAAVNAEALPKIGLPPISPSLPASSEPKSVRSGGGIWKDPKNIWEALGADTGTSVQGGIPFGVPVEIISPEQEVLLSSIFDMIKSQDVGNLDKDHIEVHTPR